MAQTEEPQLYLVTPPAFDLGSFPATLARTLDAHPVACLRLAWRPVLKSQWSTSRCIRPTMYPT